MTDHRELRKLVEQTQNGDLDAFGRIYDLLYDRIYAFVLHQVGSRTHAEDITAGVFVGALEKLEGFSWRGAGFTAWLYRIARNDVVDHFRRHGRNLKELAVMEEALELPSDVRVDEMVESAWSELELIQAVRRLSDDQRQVVLLRLVGNLSNRQIGKVVSKSEGAVKALQHRALQNLRKMLGES